MKVDGVPCRDFRTVAADVEERDRFCLAGGRLYEVTTTYWPGARTGPRVRGIVEAFIESFPGDRAYTGEVARRRTLRFGLSVQNYGEYGDPMLLAELAREAERAGWDGFFVWDHLHLRRRADQPFVDPMIALAAIATATERIRIGTLVTSPARRRPWKLAREAVTLDHLSRGRLILGVGLGWSAAEDFEPFGEAGTARGRAERLDEALEVIDGLWSGEPFTYEGRHHRVRDVRFLPRPVQRPRIPIWVGGNRPGRAVTRRGARWDGVFPQKITNDPEGWMFTPAEIEEIVGEIREGPESGAPFDLAMAGWPPAEDPDAARPLIERYERAGATWWMSALMEDIALLDDLRDMLRAGPWGMRAG